MHLTFKLITSLLISLHIQFATAGPWDNFGESFESFLKQINDMSHVAGKEYTIDQLSQLHRDLYILEKHQQYLILMMKNPGMIDNNLPASIESLRYRSNSARKKIKRIGKKIPALSKQTSKLQKMLYRLTYSKKNWPSSIKTRNMPDYHLEHYLLTEGKSAFQITHNARKALGTFLKTH